MRRRPLGILATAALALAALTPAAASSGTPHPDPRALPVPFTGEPWYIEQARGPSGAVNGTVGTQVSDFGSHSGIKATLLDDRPLLLAQYADGTGFGEKLDRSFLTLAAPGGAAFAPSGRRVAFSPSSWDETGSLAPPGGPALEVRAFATTISTDAFLLDLRVSNPGTDPVSFAPLFALESTAGSREFTESSHPFPSEGPSWVVSGEAGSERVTVAKSVGETTISGAKTLATSFRALAPSFPIDAVEETHRLDDYTIAIRGAAAAIPAGASTDAHVVVAFSEDSAAAADALAAAAFGSVAGDPSGARARVLADWEAFFASLPRPHLETPEALALWRASQAGLRMNLYAPRAAMRTWASVPGKAHFTFIWAWDTAIHAIGQSAWSEWSPPWSTFDPADGTMAEQQLSTLFAAQLPSGEVSMVADENGIIPLAAYSQPPVQGWAIRAAFESDPEPARARAWLEGMYGASSRYLDWWDLNRDFDRDGLAEYVSGNETGWDDTPRYVAAEGSVAGMAPVANEDAVDLQGWLVQYDETMVWAAGVLGRPSEEAAAWRARAEARSRLVDEHMWNESRGAWQDIALGAGGHSFVDVLTPAIWWPAYAGLSRDPARVRRVIESHLLNSGEFFGAYPIPTVAYDDPQYGDSSDGHYWRGQIWLVPAYAALQTLATYGYEARADDLRERLVQMMSGRGGPYETYDAKTGEVGWGSGGAGEPAVHLIGLSTAIVSEMLQSRYERHRLLFPEATGVHGYVADAAWLTDRAPAFDIDAGGGEVPRAEVDSTDGAPLRSASEIEVRLTDPQGNLSRNSGGEIVVRFPSFEGYSVFSVDSSGVRAPVALLGGPGTAFRASLTGGKGPDRFVVAR